MKIKKKKITKSQFAVNKMSQYLTGSVSCLRAVRIRVALLTVFSAALSGLAGHRQPASLQHQIITGIKHDLYM